jgi:hypothetical protein
MVALSKHLIPTQTDKLAGPQGMKEGHADHEGVPLAVAVLPGSGNERINLGLRQMLSATVFCIGSAACLANCSFCDGWRVVRDEP